MKYKKRRQYFSLYVSALAITVVIAGSMLSHSMVMHEIEYLKEENTHLQARLDSSIVSHNTTFIVENNVSISGLYEDIRDSIVEIHGVAQRFTFFGSQQVSVQGSGFVYNLNDDMIVITNYHVVQDTSDIIVTFSNGNGYTAELFGSDPYIDLAALSVNAPDTEFTPLHMVSSSSLQIGDPVIAIGNPFGLEGTVTTGIISQLGRTIEESTTGNFPIANIIQTSAPINPGNSGGPLLNYRGEVVGITTAMIANSQGLGFAVPSNAILREITSLVYNGSYDQHSWLGAAGTDMTYQIAAELGVNFSYGWLISQVVVDGAADQAGLVAGTRTVQIVDKVITIGGDIIIAIDGNKILDGDDLLAYLEEFTKPGQIIDVTVVRTGQTITIPVELGRRPLPSN